MADKKEPDPVLIRLPKEALEDIAELVQNRDQILAVAQKSATEKPAASIAGLSARFAQKAGIDLPVAAEIGMALWNLKNLQKQVGVDGKRLVEMIGKSLQVQAPKKWLEEYWGGWQQAVAAVENALNIITDDHSLLVSAKAGTLAYTHENLFTNAKLITDVRPVFDTAGERVVETVVLHTLVLNFLDGSQDRTMMTFSLDKDDIALLRRECERAERKSQVIADALKSLNPVVLPEGVEP